MTINRFYNAGVEALGDREVGIVASTPQKARDGHILDTRGIDLANYRQNPIILWSHDPSCPVATATAIGLQGNNLIARAEFAPRGASELADEICNLVKSGTVRGVSIGFNPIDAEPLDPSRPRGGQRILASELLEISFCAVPSDTGAGVVARSAAARASILSSVRALPRLPRSSIERAVALMTTLRGKVLSGANVLASAEPDDDAGGRDADFEFRQRQAEALALIGAGYVDTRSPDLEWRQRQAQALGLSEGAMIVEEWERADREKRRAEARALASR